MRAIEAHAAHDVRDETKRTLDEATLNFNVSSSLEEFGRVWSGLKRFTVLGRQKQVKSFFIKCLLDKGSCKLLKSPVPSNGGVFV